MDYIAEPFKIKAVEPLKILTRAQREQKIKDAGYNLFSLPARDVYIDLMTDSGTGAMSQNQWAAIMTGDEAYAGADSYYHLMDACKEIFGYTFFQPVHQGRAAEKVFFPIMLSDGKVAVSNTFFDTTRAHVELAGATALDCAVPEAADTDSFYPFKGNMDIALLEKAITERGARSIGVIVMTVTNNSAGGQPVSMQNIRETAAVAKKHEIPFVIDAARYAENAYFIQTREDGYADKSIIAIAREMFSYADAFLMSAKKDGIVNMGGLIGVKEDELLIRAVKERVIPFEGFITYGGMAGRDLDALAVGLLEATDEAYLRYRIGQAEYLGDKLRAAGVPIQYPHRRACRICGRGQNAFAHSLRPIPRPRPGRRPLRGGGHPLLRDRLLHARPRPQNRRTAQVAVRAHPPGHPPPRLHPGPLGRRRPRPHRHQREKRDPPRLFHHRRTAGPPPLHGEA